MRLMRCVWCRHHQTLLHSANSARETSPLTTAIYYGWDDIKWNRTRPQWQWWRWWALSSLQYVYGKCVHTVGLRPSPDTERTNEILYDLLRWLKHFRYEIIHFINTMHLSMRMPNMDEIWLKLFIMYEMRFTVCPPNATLYNNVPLFGQHCQFVAMNLTAFPPFNIYKLDRSVDARRACVVVQQWEAKKKKCHLSIDLGELKWWCASRTERNHCQVLWLIEWDVFSGGNWICKR